MYIRHTDGKPSSKVEVMALINVFQAENHCIIEIGLEGTGKD